MGDCLAIFLEEKSGARSTKNDVGEENHLCGEKSQSEPRAKKQARAWFLSLSEKTMEQLFTLCLSLAS